MRRALLVVAAAAAIVVAAPAKSLFRKQPDSPKDLRILWEPRYGDIAASGDLGRPGGDCRVAHGPAGVCVG
jgi:hypothetical protein